MLRLLGDDPLPRISAENDSRTGTEAQGGWLPPSGALGRLVASAHARAAALGARAHELRSDAERAGEPPRFSAALRARSDVGVIAELKRRSPSKGAIDTSLSAHERTLAYEEGGAAALSILTEPFEFGGATDDLHTARSAVSLPLLKKDFHVEAVQVWEARALGASVLLFIARALGPERLAALMDVSRSVGIEALVEVRSREELQWALDTGADLIGINARNLETLAVDPGLHEALLPWVPATAIAVAESGMTCRSDVERVARVGADAVLVGSALSVARDGAAAVRSLAGVSRRPRGR